MNTRELCKEIYRNINLDTKDILLAISGIAVALHYHFNDSMFKPFQLDGIVIYNYLSQYVNDSIFLAELIIIKNHTLNQIHPTIGLSPIRYLFNALYDSTVINKYDCMGEFYNELMHYTNGNAQNLGIVLTPKELTKLCIRLADIKDDDIVLDPCAGTGGFLLECNAKAIGIELRSFMCTLAIANIILYNKERKISFHCENMFNSTIKATVGITNPPYSQGSEKNPDMYEANYLKQLSHMIKIGGKIVAIVPRSTFATGMKERTRKRNDLLINNTLEGVISINPNWFSECTISPCICVFTAGVPHERNKKCIFIDATEDFDIEHIHQLWIGNVNSEKRISKCITIEDEWLYDYFVEKTQPPTKIDLEPTIKDYMQFRYQAILYNREYLLFPLPKYNSTENIHWERWTIDALFELGKVHKRKNLRKGKFPVISAMTTNNGHFKYAEIATEEGGVIAVESAVAGYSTYQHYPFTVNDHITKLIPKFDMTPYVGLYIASLLNFEHSTKYSYGYKPTKKRLPKEEIYVPVNEKGELAVTYMAKEVSDMIWKILDKTMPKHNNYFEY